MFVSDLCGRSRRNEAQSFLYQGFIVAFLDLRKRCYYGFDPALAWPWFTYTGRSPRCLPCRSQLFLNCLGREIVFHLPALLDKLT